MPTGASSKPAMVSSFTVCGNTICSPAPVRSAQEEFTIGKLCSPADGAWNAIAEEHRRASRKPAGPRHISFHLVWRSSCPAADRLYCFGIWLVSRNACRPGVCRELRQQPEHHHPRQRPHKYSTIGNHRRDELVIPKRIPATRPAAVVQLLGQVRRIVSVQNSRIRSA